ncbi:MAG: hypothetical protein RL138_30 [Bacteroidota bacterium]
MIKKSDFVKHLSQLNFRELYKLLKQKERWSNIPTDDFFFRFVVALRPIKNFGVNELYHAPGICIGEGCNNFCERGIIFYRLFANKTNTVLEDRFVTPELEDKFYENIDAEDYFSINILYLVLEGPLDVLDDIAFCKSMDFSSLIKSETEFFSIDTFHPHIFDSEAPDWKPKTSFPFAEPTLMSRFASRLKSLDSRILTKEFIERMNKEREAYLDYSFFRDAEDRAKNGFLKFYERAKVIQMIYRMDEQLPLILESYHQIDQGDDERLMEWLETYHEKFIKLRGAIYSLDHGPDNHFIERYDVIVKQDFWFMNNYSHFCFDMRPYRKVFEAITLFEEVYDEFMRKYRIMTYQVFSDNYRESLSWDSPRLQYLYYWANDGKVEDDLSPEE